jgi:hypothetical protein
MNNNHFFGPELLKKKSDSKTVYFFILTIGMIFIYNALAKDMFVIALVIAVFCAFATCSVLSSDETTFHEKGMIIRKKRWGFNQFVLNINYEDIRRVDVTFYSNASFRTKNIKLLLNNKSVIKSSLNDVQIEDFAIILENNSVPVYLDDNVRYKVKK